MTAVFFLVFCVTLVNAIPQLPVGRNGIVNTIFGDERLKGEVFEDIDNFSDVVLYNDAINPYRLPEDTIPIHYDVFWHVNIADLSFSGIVDIDIVATKPGVSEIVLHSSHTTLTSVVLTIKGETTEIPTTYNLDNTYEFLRIRPNTDLLYNADSNVVYTLSIAFESEMRRDMLGIYQSWFRNEYNEDVQWMATTQFQATSARSAFPCYDEPKFKATFAITIRRPITHKSWSCTRIRNTVATVPPSSYEDDIYHETPIMSTYLLALIVADYESQSDAEFNNGVVNFEVIARRSAINNNQGDYAFNVGRQLLAEMSSHTDLDFYSVNPNIKMTQASIPDFSAGAMENWGLLTYREAYLLYDPNHTNKNFQQRIAYILSHEIAHMWFGNLVTNEWWDVLWLNEGFARYYQYFLTDWVETHMGFETRFIVGQVHSALLSDSSNNPQPLSNPGVGSPGAVSSMFSTISYNKGAAIIRQTEHLLGFEVQRLGLRNYLRNRSFKAAVPSDLFDELQAAGNSQNALTAYGPDFSIAEYYKSWTEQPGHPVLNVNVNHQTGDMTITQRRFNINTGYAGNNNLNYIVPITFASASNPDFSNTKPTHILKDTVTIINRGSTGDEWVIFNKQQTGFYRVNYDDYTWDLITTALRGPQRLTIHEYNRAQIVNDVFQFARSGIMSYTRAFNILSFLRYETSYAPWVAAVTGFNWIRTRLATSPTLLTRFETMITSWATTVMNDLGYIEPDNEEFMRTFLRYQLAPFMCNMNHGPCRTTAKTLFDDLVNEGNEVVVDSREWVYCNGLRQGTVQNFNVMWQRFIQHPVYTEKILLLQTLGCTPHEASLNVILNSVVQDNYEIRRQDYSTAWNTAVGGNEGNTQIAFEFVKNNLNTVIAAFGGASSPLSSISSRLRTEAEIIEFQTWATQNQAALGNSFNSVYNGAENARESMRWAAAVAPDIEEYLNNGDQDLSTTTENVPQTTPPVITPRPPLPEIVNPTLPDSASTSILSITLMAVATITIILF